MYIVYLLYRLLAVSDTPSIIREFVFLLFMEQVCPQKGAHIREEAAPPAERQQGCLAP